MGFRGSIVLVASACALVLHAAPALAQQRVTKSFASSTYSDRVDACVAAKKDAQYWVSQETNQTAIDKAARGIITLVGYSACDCGETRNAVGAPSGWKCAVDATVQSSK